MRNAFIGMAAAVLLASSPANAGTVVSSFSSVAGFSNSVPAAITFEQGPLGFKAADAALGYVWSGTGQLRSPPSTPDSAVPFGDTSNFYMSVLGGKEEVLTFSPTAFPTGAKLFQLFIGSIDTYNSITFMSGKLTQTIDGTDLLNSVGSMNSHNSGNRTSPLTNRFFSFLFNNNTQVDKIIFDSGGNSLEFDNVSAAAGVGREGGGGPIPEPATWVVMVLGFGLLGSLLRQRPRLPATSL